MLHDHVPHAAFDGIADVVRMGPAEGDHGGFEIHLDHLLDGLPQLLRDDGHSNFDAVHPQLIELLGDTDALRLGVCNPGGLLPVPERTVVDEDLFGIALNIFFRKVQRGDPEPIVVKIGLPFQGVKIKFLVLLHNVPPQLFGAIIRRAGPAAHRQASPRRGRRLFLDGKNPRRGGFAALELQRADRQNKLAGKALPDQVRNIADVFQNINLVFQQDVVYGECPVAGFVGLKVDGNHPDALLHHPLGGVGA
ncbi:hypothetical protein SDC9_137220 [bioreactor metagenome]|uniref:Uncharacterized protein n=1 Tax=bioreactor metagenome TaxID=1076179 RepID=A0A645DMT1_9ZZZZ